ncbi:MAG: NAD kinase [Bacteroidia bacterium]
MKVAIFGRITDNTDRASLQTFFDHIKARNIQFSLYRNYERQLNRAYPDLLTGHTYTVFDQREEIDSCKFVYCLGGDGTVLEAVRFIGPLQTPIIGVNFGRLGYLASTSKHDVVKATEEILSDSYTIAERSLIEVASEVEPSLFGEHNFGINDITIHKSNTNEMITVHAYLNGEFLNSYRGDGLIVATPTGSTAYSLSCGGPIIFPKSNVLVITPVAPHSLTVRPVIIPDDWVVSFKIESRSGEALVALDTRTERVKSGTQIAVKRASFPARLVRVSPTKYIDNLRNSLMWGSDQRN